MRKWVVLVAVLVLGGAAAWFGARLHLPTLIEIGPGYTADVACGCVFISGRTLESCVRDLDPLARRFVSVSVAPTTRSVTASTLGMFRRTARHRNSYGCTLED